MEVGDPLSAQTPREIIPTRLDNVTNEAHIRLIALVIHF